MSNELVMSLLEDVLESINIIIERTRNIKTHLDFVKNDQQLQLFDSVAMRL